MAFIDGAAVERLQRALDIPTRGQSDGVLARLYGFHIDLDRSGDRDAVIRRTPRHVGCVGAGDEGLGRRAAGVDARSAEELAFDHRYFLACLCEPSSQRRAGLPRPNDDRIIPVHGFAS